jgi:protein-S-isoprenylcysteine O-methyltransferase Ste14
MSKILTMLVAVVCYFAFFVAFVYFVGFLAAVPELPAHIDKGRMAPPAKAALIDIGLIALFGLQHSVMARKGFKAWLTRIVPASLERSIYCLASALVLGALYMWWHPIDAVIWNMTSDVGRMLLWALFLAGFAMVFISTWLISHFELFGLAQAWANLRGNPIPEGRFVTPLFYKAVRHPIYTGFFIAMWATPMMSAGHLLFAVGMTIYLLIGIRYEERDLVGQFGDAYVEYRAKVGMIIPGVGRS